MIVEVFEQLAVLNEALLQPDAIQQAQLGFG